MSQPMFRVRLRLGYKLFYRAPWETGHEVADEYRAWLDQCENVSGFERLEADEHRGNWHVVYFAVIW